MDRGNGQMVQIPVKHCRGEVYAGDQVSIIVEKGAPYHESGYRRIKKSVCLILCLTLICGGAHKFYSGHTFQGFAYLLLTLFYQPVTSQPSQQHSMLPESLAHSIDDTLSAAGGCHGIYLTLVLVFADFLKTAASQPDSEGFINI